MSDERATASGGPPPSKRDGTPSKRRRRASSRRNTTPVPQEWDPVRQIPPLCAPDNLAERVVNNRTLAPFFLPAPRPAVSSFREQTRFRRRKSLEILPVGS